MASHHSREDSSRTWQPIVIAIHIVEVKPDGSLATRGRLHFAFPPQAGDLIFLENEERHTLKVLRYEHLPNSVGPDRRVVLIAEWASQYEAGRLIRHTKHGIGRVISTDGNKLTAVFESGRKMVLDSFVEPVIDD
ncbi:MAG: hypothetical protein MIL41_11405 [Hyphomicrobiales bacterium]